MQANLMSRIRYIFLAFLILLSDRVSKSAITDHFELGQPVAVIDGLFNITYVQNTGIAFGFFSTLSSPVKVLILSLVAGIAAIVVVIYSLRHDPRNSMLQVALAMILAGALGNLYDRILYGYVIDFLELHVRGYYWPSFNIADTSISIGVILLAWEMFRNEAPNRT